MYLQLKPYEDNIFKFMFDGVEKLDVIVLCEGRDEVECFKAVSEKLNVRTTKIIGITDSMGITAVRKLIHYIISLLKVIRKIKIIAVLVDAEYMSFEDRARSILDSIRAKGFRVGDPHNICHHTYKTYVARNNGDVDVVIAVNGDENLPFNKHRIEDNIIILMTLENKIDRERIEKCKDSKELVGKVSIKALIKNSKKENVERAFKHVVCLIKEIENS